MSEQMITTRDDIPFAITNDQTAEWAVRKIREAEEDTKRWTEYYDKQLSAIRRANEDTVTRLTAYLADYFESVPHRKTKTQESYQLPSCKLILKARQLEYTRDEEALCNYLERTGRTDMIRITRRADWAALKKSVTVLPDGSCADEDGDIIEGLQAVAREPEFVVDIKTEGNKDGTSDDLR